MRRSNIYPAYVVGIIVILALVSVWYQHQDRQTSTAPVAAATSTQSTTTNTVNDPYAAALKAINPSCAAYYNDAGQGPDPITNELADFTGLHPLSDFLCGQYSNVVKGVLADGKTLYFVAPISSLDCGSGGCTYYSLLGEKKGLVRHIRGFTSYSDAGSTSTISSTQDTDGTVFGFPSFPKKGEVETYWHTSADCGVTSIYTFTATDTPVLVSASDSCLPGKGILYPMK